MAQWVIWMILKNGMIPLKSGNLLLATPCTEKDDHLGIFQLLHLAFVLNKSI
jgi:hypothetical protein